MVFFARTTMNAQVAVVMTVTEYMHLVLISLAVSNVCATLGLAALERLDSVLT